MPPADIATCVGLLNDQTSREAQRDAQAVRLLPALARTIRMWLALAWRPRAAADLPALLAAAEPEARRWLVMMKRWERSLSAPVPGVVGTPHDPVAVGRGGAVRRQRLTILLMTKNEERRIERCLASVAWADEVVVVDGQSTDRTAELCRRAGARVVSRPFSGSFAEERNAGLDAATGQWILQMDADETVTPDLRCAIERILKEPSPIQAYKVRRRNIFLGRVMRFGGWYHDHLCLFRRGHRYHGLVHERLNVTGPVGRVEADLQHEPFQSLEQFVTRQNRYTTLQARELFEARGPLPWRDIRRTLRWRPLNRWWKFYVKKQGWREGMHGLVFSALYAWVDFVVWAKVAELASPQGGDGR